jgi:hypothetical protein
MSAGIELIYNGFMIGIGVMLAIGVAMAIFILLAYLSGKLLKEY